MQPHGDFVKLTVEKMQDKNGGDIQTAPHAQMTIKMKLPKQFPENSMLRKSK